MAQITKDTLLWDVLRLDEGTVPFFTEIGMHCLGCPSMRYETVGAACAVHGVNPDELVNKINAYLESK